MIMTHNGKEAGSSVTSCGGTKLNRSVERSSSLVNDISLSRIQYLFSISSKLM